MESCSLTILTKNVMAVSPISTKHKGYEDDTRFLQGIPKLFGAYLGGSTIATKSNDSVRCKSNEK